MGTLEDIQDRDRETQAAIAAVTEAVNRDTFHPTDQGLGQIHMAVDRAKSAVRVEMAALKAVLAKLEALDTETKLRLQERADIAARRRLEHRATPEYVRSAAELDESAQRLARARGPSIALPGGPIPMRGGWPMQQAEKAYRTGEPTRPPPEAFGRYAAPPPPSGLDERREEWRRKHGLE